VHEVPEQAEFETNGSNNKALAATHN